MNNLTLTMIIALTSIVYAVVLAIAERRQWSFSRKLVVIVSGGLVNTATAVGIVYNNEVDTDILKSQVTSLRADIKSKDSIDAIRHANLMASAKKQGFQVDSNFNVHISSSQGVQVGDRAKQTNNFNNTFNQPIDILNQGR